MTSLPYVRWLLQAAVACILLAAASGCEPKAPKPPEPMTSGITGYNYTREGVQEYYVNGNRGSNLPPYGGGGALSCCVALPAEWISGLTVDVDWTIGHYTEPWEKRKGMTLAEENKCCWSERTLRRAVPVERYGKEGGDVQVFFLPNDELQVWVYDAGPQNPGHPSHRGYPKSPETRN
jgi:hypothetical protein